MSQPVVIPDHAHTCPGCAGNGGCWVCLSTGQIDDGIHRRACHRCSGSGICGEGRRLIVLPEQTVRSF